MSDNNCLLRTDRENVATLVLNRPHKFNALSEELLDQLLIELSSIQENSSIAAVVIAANGKAFCAGHDLRQMRDNHSTDYYRTLFNRCSEMMQLIANLPQPVIASVQGVATAAGCQLVATCDLAIAASSASFAVSGINLGLFCSTPSVALSRNLSRKRAFDMLVTGDFIDAHTALEYGLINRVVEDHTLELAVDEYAQKIAAKPAAALSIGKKLFYEQLGKDLPDAYKLAAEVMACNMTEPETVEYVDAFLQKRPVKKPL